MRSVGAVEQPSLAPLSVPADLSAVPTPTIAELTRRLLIDAKRLALLQSRTSSPESSETIARAEDSNASLRSECQRAALGIDMASRRRLAARVSLQLRLTSTLMEHVNIEQRDL